MNTPLPERKRPVHMPPVERHNEPVIRFVALVTQPRVPAFADIEWVAAVKAAVCVVPGTRPNRM